MARLGARRAVGRGRVAGKRTVRVSVPSVALPVAPTAIGDGAAVASANSA